MGALIWYDMVYDLERGAFSFLEPTTRDITFVLTLHYSCLTIDIILEPTHAVHLLARSSHTNANFIPSLSTKCLLQITYSIPIHSILYASLLFAHTTSQTHAHYRCLSVSRMSILLLNTIVNLTL
jgi:hypothetical protein